MTWAGGLFLAVAGLLMTSGATKLWSPEPTRQALRTAGLPVPPGSVRAMAAGEVVLGLVAALTGARVVAALMAAVYLAYAGFVVVARRRGGGAASCGCFGRPEIPPTVAHLVLDLGMAAVAALVAAGPGAPAGLLGLLGRSPVHGVVLAGFALIATWLIYLVLDVAPGARSA